MPSKNFNIEHIHPLGMEHEDKTVQPVEEPAVFDDAPTHTGKRKKRNKFLAAGLAAVMTAGVIVDKASGQNPSGRELRKPQEKSAPAKPGTKTEKSVGKTALPEYNKEKIDASYRFTYTLKPGDSIANCVGRKREELLRLMGFAFVSNEKGITKELDWKEWYGFVYGKGMAAFVKEIQTYWLTDPETQEEAKKRNLIANGIWDDTTRDFANEVIFPGLAKVVDLNTILTPLPQVLADRGLAFGKPKPGGASAAQTSVVTTTETATTTTETTEAPENRRFTRTIAPGSVPGDDVAYLKRLMIEKDLMVPRPGEAMNNPNTTFFDGIPLLKQYIWKNERDSFDRFKIRFSRNVDQGLLDYLNFKYPLSAEETSQSTGQPMDTRVNTPRPSVPEQSAQPTQNAPRKVRERPGADSEVRTNTPSPSTNPDGSVNFRIGDLQRNHRPESPQSEAERITDATARVVNRQRTSGNTPESTPEYRKRPVVKINLPQSAARWIDPDLKKRYIFLFPGQSGQYDTELNYNITIGTSEQGATRERERAGKNVVKSVLGAIISEGTRHIKDGRTAGSVEEMGRVVIENTPLGENTRAQQFTVNYRQRNFRFGHSVTFTVAEISGGRERRKRYDVSWLETSADGSRTVRKIELPSSVNDSYTLREFLAARALPMVIEEALSQQENR